MTRRPRKNSMIFGAGGHVYVIVGIFAALFLTLGVLIQIKRSNGTFLACSIAATTIGLLLPAYLRLELGCDGFTYRNLSMNRSVRYSEIANAYLRIHRSEYAPQGVAFFWLALRDGTPMQINLHTFPMRAAAILFAALEHHQIPIDVPDHRAARSMVRQIHQEQARLRIQRSDR